MDAISKLVRLTSRALPSKFDKGIGARLPKEFRKFYDEWKEHPPQPVHYIADGRKWIRDENTGEVKRVQDIPIPETVPDELHQVMTGGETVIAGLRKREYKYSHRIPKNWVPVSYRSVVYSEILDKYMSVLMTKRAVELIHKHGGLDKYLLETKACDLKTLVSIRLKRKLLLCLRDKQLPYDEEKNKKIMEKYEKYLLPPEEVEWYGLSFSQACKKLEEIEEKNKLDSIVPLKNIYRLQLIEELKSEKLLKAKVTTTEESNWLSKIPGISKLSNTTKTK